MSSPPPRTIEGSIGSHIRVVLGKDRHQWCLILNHDDGENEWQERHWSNTLPVEMIAALQECSCDILGLDLGGPRGGDSIWYLSGTKEFLRFSKTCHTVFKTVVGDNQHNHWWKLSFGDRRHSSSMCYLSDFNNDCLHNLSPSLIERIQSAEAIDLVRLFQNGGFFLQDNKGKFANRLPQGIHKGLLDDKLGGRIHDLAIAGDGQWMVIGPDAFASSSGVDEVLRGHVKDFYTLQLQRNHRNQQDIAAHQQKQPGKEMAYQQKQPEKERVSRVVEAEHYRKAQQDEPERLEQEKVQARENEHEESLKARKVEIDLKAKAIEEAERELANRKLAMEADLRKREQWLQEQGSHQKAKQQSLDEREQDIQQRDLKVEAKAQELVARQRELQDQEHNAKQTANHDDPVEGAICVVCMVEAAEIAAYPCGHLCFCEGCSAHYRTGGSQSHKPCPNCKQRIERVMKIYGLPSSQSQH